MTSLPVSKRDDGALTCGDVYFAAMKIRDPEDAAQYVEQVLDYQMSRFKPPEVKDTRDEQRAVVLQNIGYWSGYYDHDTMVRVQQVFDCSHPVFGRAKAGELISPEAAFAAGLKSGRGER